MTLILSCLTQGFAVQVADRRLTDVKTGELVDDDATKAVLFGTQMMFAYTGLARMRAGDRDATHVWLAETILPEVDVMAAVELIREQASLTLSRIANLGPRAKRHAFVGVGFPSGASGSPRPCLVTISNALQKDGSWADNAAPTFSVRTKWLAPTSEFHLSQAGVPLAQDGWKALRSDVRAALRGASPPLKVMAALIRALSQVQDRRVGDGMNVSYLPVATGTDEPWAFAEDLHDWSPDQFEASTPLTIYVNPSSGDHIHYSPMVVRAAAALAAFATDRVLSPEEVKAMWASQKRQYGR